jgi:two-component system response regulator AlgR
VRGSRLAEAILRADGLRASAVKQALASTAAELPLKRQSFSVLERGRVLLVPVADVLYLKADQKYVSVHTKERSYLLEESLVSLEEEFSDLLIRVHRNTLIARKAIGGVERASKASTVPRPQDESEADQEKNGDTWQVIVRDTGERLSISRRQWPAVKAIMR